MGLFGLADVCFGLKRVEEVQVGRQNESERVVCVCAMPLRYACVENTVNNAKYVLIK